MKLTLLVIGKTDSAYLSEGINEYIKRLKHYVNFNLEVIPDLRKNKNRSNSEQMMQEGDLILTRDMPGRELHLFDENGKPFSSRGFAAFIEKKMASGLKELVLVIGGPYGFSAKVQEKAVSKISLSPMTFSHQMARLLCVEQIYRAFTIIKGEPYHHD